MEGEILRGAVASAMYRERWRGCKKRRRMQHISIVHQIVMVDTEEDSAYVA